MAILPHYFQIDFFLAEIVVVDFLPPVDQQMIALQQDDSYTHQLLSLPLSLERATRIAIGS